MPDRIREDALLRIGENALVDLGCCLNRFEVDSIQSLSWKLHTYLANKSHILPVRLLQTTQINGYGTYVTSRGGTSGRVSPKGTPQGRFQLALAAIKDSNVEYLGETLVYLFSIGYVRSLVI